MKLGNIDRESLHKFCKFWMTVNEISIKSSGMMFLMIILNITKKAGFQSLFRRCGRGRGQIYSPRHL